MTIKVGPRRLWRAAVDPSCRRAQFAADGCGLTSCCILRLLMLSHMRVEFIYSCSVKGYFSDIPVPRTLEITENWPLTASEHLYLCLRLAQYTWIIFCHKLTPWSTNFWQVSMHMTWGKLVLVGVYIWTCNLWILNLTKNSSMNYVCEENPHSFNKYSVNAVASCTWSSRFET
jgi:hypothetical protein